MTNDQLDPNAPVTADGARPIHGEWSAEPDAEQDVALNTNVGAVVAPQGEGPGTTHAGYGAGDPRLVLVGSTAAAPDGVAPPAATFALTGERMTIGSGPDADVRIGGLDQGYGEIVHTSDDEYVLFVDGAADTSGEPNIILNGRPGHILRTGAQVRFGDTEFVFQREEYADHGRPFAGREGGEFAHQEQQVDPRLKPGEGVADYRAEHEVE